MEIIKNNLKDNIVKVDIGGELSEDQSRVEGSVELDIENQAYFVDMVNSIFDDGCNKLLINMSNVDYVDSSGLWALFEGHKKAMQRGGKFILLCPTKDVQRVLDITKMSSKIDIFNDQQEALSELGSL